MPPPTMNIAADAAAGDRQQPHQPRRERQDRAAQPARPGARARGQRPAGVVEPDDAGDQAVDADGHHQRDRAQHRDAHADAGVGDGAQCDHDDLGRQDEVGAHRAGDLGALGGDQIDRGIGDRLDQRLVVRAIVGGVVQPAVGELVAALVAEERAAQHQQRQHQPRHDQADHERRRDDDRLVAQRALGHRPHHRQLALGLDPGDLLGVQREIVAEHAGGLLGRGAGEDDDVVEDERDVVEEREEARGHRSPTVATSARLASAAAITPARAS